MMVAALKQRHTNPTTASPNTAILGCLCRHVPPAVALPRYFWEGGGGVELNGWATGHKGAVLWPTSLPYGESMWWLKHACTVQRMGLSATAAVEIWLGLGKRHLRETLRCWSCLGAGLWHSTWSCKWGRTRIALALSSRWNSQETLESLM